MSLNQIVMVRGANGSGKSTVVRRVIEQTKQVDKVALVNRKRPFAYYMPQRVLYVPGHYETPCGGCDSISEVGLVYGLVQDQFHCRHNVLFEGILAQHSTTRLLELARQTEGRTTAILLTTTYEECVEAVLQRRRERGDSRPFDPRNVRKEYDSVLRSTEKLEQHVDVLRVMRLSREEALQRVLTFFPEV